MDSNYLGYNNFIKIKKNIKHDLVMRKSNYEIVLAKRNKRRNHILSVDPNFY